MKKILILLLVAIFNLSNGQNHGTPVLVQNCTSYTIIPLRTFTDIPEDECYYLKDTNNELEDYEGVWRGDWNNKTIYITFKKIVKTYNWIDKYHSDYLIAKYKVVNNLGNILFDNTSLPDDRSKIEGIKFRKSDDKYGLIYVDPELCHTTGNIRINFTDATKSQITWWYNKDTNWLNKDCFFYSYPPSQYPEPLPKNIILTKQ